MSRPIAILRVVAVISSATLFAAFVSYRALSSSGNWRRMFSAADSPGVTPIADGAGRALLPGSKDLVGIVTPSGDLEIPSPKWAPIVKPAEAEAPIGTPHPAKPTLDTDVKPAEAKPIPAPDASGSGPKRVLMPGTKKLPLVFSQSDIALQASQSTLRPLPPVTKPASVKSAAAEPASAEPNPSANDVRNSSRRQMISGSKSMAVFPWEIDSELAEYIHDAKQYLKETDNALREANRLRKLKERRFEESKSQERPNEHLRVRVECRSELLVSRGRVLAFGVGISGEAAAILSPGVVDRFVLLSRPISAVGRTGVLAALEVCRLARRNDALGFSRFGTGAAVVVAGH
jgi:hypothetical protein